MKSGDEIIEIDGKKIGFYEDIVLYTSDFNEETEAKVKVKRGDEKLTISFKPTVNETTYNYKEDYVEVITSINGHQTSQKYEYTDGIDQEQIQEMIGKTETQKRLIIGFVPKQEEVGINNIFSYSYHYTIYVVKMVYTSFWDMITGKVGLENVSGPVGIVGVVNEAVNTGSYGFVNILFLTALITINLGIFNLLPIPALDGGRLVFLIIELFRRKPLPDNKEEIIHTIGLVALLILSVFIAFSDIFKLVK